MIKTYVEFNASRSGFVLMKEIGSPFSSAFVKGGFDTIKEATDWGVENGYQVNRYEDGKLVESKFPFSRHELLKEKSNHFNISEFQQTIKDEQKMTARKPGRFYPSKRIQTLDLDTRQKQPKQPEPEGLIGRALRAMARLRNDR
jgi:hypothetical protein